MVNDFDPSGLQLSPLNRGASRRYGAAIEVRFWVAKCFGRWGVLSAICCKCFCWENNRNYLFV